MTAIVVGADGSEHGMRAVAWAAEEAVRRGLPLRIVHAVAPWLYDTPVDPRLGAVRKWLLTSGQEVVDEAIAAARARAGNLRVDGEPVPGGAARALLEQSRTAAMIVLGSHGVGTMAGLLLGSTALQVVAHTRVPALVVRHLEPAVHEEIIVGVDGSAGAESALDFAFEEAALRKAGLRVIHVWSHPDPAALGGMMPLVYDPEIITADQTRRLRDSLTGWEDKYPDVQVVTEVVHGRPVGALAAASAQADLLVVGTRGRGGFAGLVLGSVSHGLLHYTRCPLAVVPST